MLSLTCLNVEVYKDIDQIRGQEVLGIAINSLYPELHGFNHRVKTNLCLFELPRTDVHCREIDEGDIFCRNRSRVCHPVDQVIEFELCLRIDLRSTVPFKALNCLVCLSDHAIGLSEILKHLELCLSIGL